MGGADGIQQGAIAFVEEHNAVEIIGGCDVGHYGRPEFAYIRLVEAHGSALAAIEADLEEILNAGYVVRVIKAVQHGGKDPDISFFCGCQHFGKDVEISEIGGAHLVTFQGGLFVEFRMGGGIMPAMIVLGVIFLYTMVRQRHSRHLPAGDTAVIGKSADDNGIDRSALLEDVKNLVDAFIYK